MFKNLRKGFFPSLIAFSALSVSASAAFYSVSGLSKLFAGASFEVIIMAGSLEVAKLVIASLLYQYWDTINKWLRTYLAIATVVLVLITSMGIYGFLSAAYQETYSKLLIQENQIEFIENKAQFYEEDIERYDIELARISDNINILSNAKASGIQVRDTTSSTGFRQTISTTELRMAQKRIEVEEENRRGVQNQRQVAADSLQTFRLQILDLQNTNETASELGPLQYLSGLTGTPMDKIINWLLLVIIFVFDPLAISLVIAANFAFAQAFPRKEDEDTEYVPSNSVWDNIEDRVEEDEVDEDDLYDNRGSVYYDEEDEEFDEDHALNEVLNDMVEDMDEDAFLDQPARKSRPTMDVSIDHEDAEKWNQLADELAKGSAQVAVEDEDYNWEEDQEVLDFLDEMDKPGPWSEEDDKIHTVGGLTADKDGDFMKFQDKMDENDAAREIDVIDPEEVSSKFEVEDTAGNVNVYDESESEFPNENNPTSVAATVEKVKNEFGTYPSIVEKIETPHLPDENTTTLPPEARGVEPPKVTKKVVKKSASKVETTTKAPINEDDLFDEAMRKKAEQDKLDYLRKKDEDSKK